ncbi:hypothetical protein Clacol_003741 [Clathrus columnatus]|uniref:Uncharacterized protein n=1 Tax=Clathrus columnatus TaxID=1419009 RepID=A0AAV5A8J6_9AGAM|nr:hypothetical protein Clacol_003741 [Clathrus columnatus]
MASEEQPKPQRSLNGQQILEEDEYTAAMSEIIARDFFPSLVHLDATNSYLDALQSQDPERITNSVRHLQDLATPHPGPSTSSRAAPTPSRTPFGLAGETPMHTASNLTNLLANKRRPYDNSNMSLDEFQAKYTSEDNASFSEILNEENKQRKEKWSWAWEAQKRARGIKAIEDVRRNKLLIEDSVSQPPGVVERLVIERHDVKMITGPETQVTKDKQMARVSRETDLAILSRPPAESKEVIDVMAPRKDSRSAAVDGWSFKARNSLMFSPDADRSPYDGPTSLPTKTGEGIPKIIKHANTRLEQPDQDGNDNIDVPLSPTHSRIGAAIAGEPYSKATTTSDFSLLPSIPSPTPAQLGPVAVNKLMTWGTITGTPRVLPPDPTGDVHVPSTPFHLPPPTTRERVAHKLASTASRSLRAKASLLSGTPTPFGGRESSGRKGMTPRHSGLLTPAARRLLDRTAGLGTTASRRAEAMQRGTNWEGTGKGKDMSGMRWTPSPITRRAV